MRRRVWLAFMVAVLLGACDEDDAETDGGPDKVDARSSLGADAGGGDAEAGLEDAGARDAGEASRDGGPSDGGATECAAAVVVIGERCPAFEACGGALVEGEYCLAGLCIEEEDLLAPMRPYCAAFVVETATGSATGRLSLAGGEQIARASVTALEVTARFPESCVVNGCDEVGSLIEREVRGSTAACAMSDGCRCDVAIRAETELNETYANTAAGTLSIGSGPTEREYDYCVDEAGGSVRLRDRSGGLAEPGIQSIARR